VAGALTGTANDLGIPCYSAGTATGGGARRCYVCKCLFSRGVYHNPEYSAAAHVEACQFEGGRRAQRKIETQRSEQAGTLEESQEEGSSFVDW
jgi:hypothetical protein